MSQPLLILSVIAGYFIVWMIVSYFSSKGADNSTFFSGNRKMPWPLVAVAMIGAPITGVTFISVPGMVAAKGYSYLQMGLGFIVGYIIIALVLIPLYYKLNIVSIYGFLQKRFGRTSSKTGAWLFFISKILGISIRFLMVCAMLQLIVFDPLGISYIYSVIIGLILVWISTYKGGVKSVIWGDVLKSFCLIATIALCFYFIASNLGFSLGDLASEISSHSSSQILYLDDPMEGKYFWKQFIAGIVIVIAMTGLDQDMMQRTLACRNPRDARKNLIVSSVMQVAVIALLLFLGSALMIYTEMKGLEIPAKTDNLFATVAFHQDIPVIVGALFVLGLIAATYASVGSALTAMTTSMTVDILEADRKEGLSRRRKMVHTMISVAMAAIVIFFYYLNQEDALSTVFTLISYTDGPILGLFLFGILSKRQVNQRWLPLVCILSPILSWFVQWLVRYWFAYETSYELIILNAAFTYCGMRMISDPVDDKAGSSNFITA